MHVLNVASHPKFWHSGSFLVQILVLFEYRFIFPKAYDLGWGERILKRYFLFLTYWTFKSYSVEVYCPREYFACCMPSDRLDYSVLVAAKALSDGLSLGCFCFRLLYLVNHDEGRAQYEHNMFTPTRTHTHTHCALVQLRFRHTIIGKWPQKTLNWMTTVWCSEIVRNLKSKNSVQRKSCKGSLLRKWHLAVIADVFFLRTAAKTAPVILMLQMPCMRSTMKTRRTTITSRSLTKYHRHSEAEETFSIPINAPSLLTSSWWEGVHSYVFLVYKQLLRTFMSS